MVDVLPCALSKGVYLPAEAARIVRADILAARHDERAAPSLATITRWARQRMPEPVDGDGWATSADAVSFLDLVELHFIAIFRRHGVSWPTIRTAAGNLTRQFGAQWPFATREFYTDGSTVFIGGERPPAAAEECVSLQDLKLGQHVFRSFAMPYVSRVDWGEQHAERLWPLGKEAPVLIDPQRAFGKPLDSESGVPTRVLYEALSGDASAAEVADWFGVPVTSVDAAVQYERALRAA